MTVSSVIAGKLDHPLRVLLYGVEGIGKSTFGASAPGAVFVGAEDGTAHLDVKRMCPLDENGSPVAMTWQDVLDAVRALTVEPHEYKTLVVDTLDWLEPLLWAHICRRDNETSIESYGYGKGYAAALDEWRVLLASLEQLRARRRMHIVFLAHAWIKAFKNPEGEDFDRYELKLNAKASGLMKEWSDAVLFANYQTHAVKDEKTKRTRGYDTGARLIYTQRRAAYDAKNRHDLPEELPLAWSEFEAAVREHRPADPAQLAASIQAKLGELDAESSKKAAAALRDRAGNAAALAKLADWVNAKIMLAPAAAQKGA
jgi:hypothetical protein